MDKLLEYWEIISGAVVSVIAFLGGRKMKNIDEKKAGGDALITMQSAYDDFVKDQKERYEELKKELNYVREELKLSKEIYLELRGDLKLEKQKYATLEKKYMTLKKAFEDYRKKNDKNIVAVSASKKD